MRSSDEILEVFTREGFSILFIKSVSVREWRWGDAKKYWKIVGVLQSPQAVLSHRHPFNSMHELMSTYVNNWPI